MFTKEKLKRLKDIRNEMSELLAEANDIMRSCTPTHEYERARAYWIGHIDSALGGGDYFDLQCSLKSTIEEMKKSVPSDNSLDSDDDEEEW